VVLTTVTPRRITFGTTPDGNVRSVAPVVVVVIVVGTPPLPRVRTSGVGAARGIDEPSFDRSDEREAMERLSSAIMDGTTAIHARHDHPRNGVRCKRCE